MTYFLIYAHIYINVSYSFCGVYGSTGGKRYDVRSSLQQFKDIMDEGNHIVDCSFVETVTFYQLFKHWCILSFIYLFTYLFIYLFIYLLII